MARGSATPHRRCSQAEIARTLDMSRTTVRRLLRLDRPPRYGIVLPTHAVATTPFPALYSQDSCPPLYRGYSLRRCLVPLLRFTRLLRSLTKEILVRWPNLVARFEQWFAAAAAGGEPELAERFVIIAQALSDAEHGGSPGLQVLFDH